MTNPWLKKNPFMSLWLSQANRVAGMARAQSTAQAKRSAARTAAAYNPLSVITDLWLGTALAAKPAKVRRKR